MVVDLVAKFHFGSQIQFTIFGVLQLCRYWQFDLSVDMTINFRSRTINSCTNHPKTGLPILMAILTELDEVIKLVTKMKLIYKFLRVTAMAPNLGASKFICAYINANFSDMYFELHDLTII